MIYQTYTCSMADGSIEYGFCFKNTDDDDDCCLEAEIIIGYVYPEKQGREKALREMRRKWHKYEWMAKAICAAPEAP